MDNRERLLSDLSELVALLETCGESHWASWLARDRLRLQRADSQGLDHLLGAFGGMGSLSDLVIDPANGHTVEPARVDEINSRLSRLRSRVYEAARRLRLDT